MSFYIIHRCMYMHLCMIKTALYIGMRLCKNNDRCIFVSPVRQIEGLLFAF
jgi:hypothetical protein